MKNHHNKNNENDKMIPVTVDQEGKKMVQYTKLCSEHQETTWRYFINVVWKAGGGGRTFPKPILEVEGDDFGKGCTRWIPIFRNTGIREKITDINYPNRIYYRVMNPSLVTFPVKFHRGYIDFIALSSNSTQVVWTIDFTPKRGMNLIVRGLIKMAIPRYLNILARKCSE